MNAVQYEAMAIVHGGLADILHWLGEQTVEPWEPRHAAEWEYVELYTLASPEVAVRVDHYQVPN